MIRARRDDDLAACAAIAAEVHATDGYPSFLGDDTFESFVAPRDALAAWVAVRDGDVAGNVVLRPRSAPGSVVPATERLGVPAEQLGFVARLMVAPAARRTGLARDLLAASVDGARSRDLVAVLDVVTRDVGALALYDAVGWRRLGGHTMMMRSGGQLELAVYAAP